MNKYKCIVPCAGGCIVTKEDDVPPIKCLSEAGCVRPVSWVKVKEPIKPLDIIDFYDEDDVLTFNYQNTIVDKINEIIEKINKE